MNTKVNISFAYFVQSILIVLLLLILIFVSTDSIVKGQIVGIDNPIAVNQTGSQSVIAATGVVEGGPGFIMVSPFAFKPLHMFDQWAYLSGGLYNPSTSPSEFVVGLTLPHNATLTKLTIYYKDDDIYELYCELYRSGEIEAVAHIQTSGAVTDFQILSTTNFTYPVVDNQNYSYWLRVYFPEGHIGSQYVILKNVRIDYAYTSDLPLVMKN